MVIYKATNRKNGKVYIGQTVKSFRARRLEHKRDFEKYKNIPFYIAIRKYGWNCFDWEVIDKADTYEELDKKEIYWIEYYDSYGSGGYNATKGGRGMAGYQWSLESKNKFSQRSLGAGNNNSTLTESDVLSIRELLADGWHQKDIAIKFDVSQGTISGIANGKTWTNVRDDSFVSKIKPKRLNRDIVVRIMAMLHKGLSVRDISLITGFSDTTIRNVRNRKIFGDFDLHIDKQGNERISKEYAKYIKIYLQEGVKSKDIAELFNVSPLTVHNIKTGKTHTDILLEQSAM